MALERDEQSDALAISLAKGVFPLQVVRWSGQRVAVTTSGVSQRLVIPADSDCIEITLINDTYVNFGDVTVEATTAIASDGSRLMLAGVQLVPMPLDPVTGDAYTHVAVIRAATNGVFQIEKVL